MVLVSENKFFGLWQGPIDHKASSVINAIYDTPENAITSGPSLSIRIDSPLTG